jgi:hypothetical protein
MTETIEAHGLRKRYPPDVEALDDLGLAVEEARSSRSWGRTAPGSRRRSGF